MKNLTVTKKIALTAAGLALGCAVVVAPKAAVAEDTIAIASDEASEVSELKQRRDEKGHKQRRDEKGHKQRRDEK